MNKKKAVFLVVFMILLKVPSFSLPGEIDFFHIKKICTITTHSVNTLLIFSAPFIPDQEYAKHIDDFYSHYCHQLPERSFRLNGRRMPVCARCTGIIIGNLIGEAACLIASGLNPYSRFHIQRSINYCLIMSSFMIPLLLDGSIQFFTGYESNNPLRLVTGILYGIAISSIIDELVRVADYYA
jgi:uncharacterized membrane protein